MRLENEAHTPDTTGTSYARKQSRFRCNKTAGHVSLWLLTSIYIIDVLSTHENTGYLISDVGHATCCKTKSFFVLVLWSVVCSHYPYQEVDMCAGQLFEVDMCAGQLLELDP